MRIEWNRIGSWIKQQSPFVQSALTKLDGLSRIMISSLKIVLLILILYYLINVALWSFEKESGIVIEPFAAKGTGQNMDGLILANLLQYDLQKIREMGMANERENITFHVKPTILVSKSGYESDYNITMALPSNIEPFEELIVVDGQRDLENSLANIGSISLEGASFSIGNILLSMKELYRNRPNSITCSIQDYGPSIIVTSIFHDNRDNGKSYSWEVKGGNLEQNETFSEKIPLLIEDLAFQITYSLGKQNSKIYDAYPQNWLAYKELLKAREAFKIYKANGSINHLNSSDNWISKASEFEPNYKGALRRSILHDLGFAFLYEQRYNDSIEIFSGLSAMDPEIGYFGLALAYYGLDEYGEALSNINRVTVLNPNNAYAWLIKGIILTSMGENVDAIETLNRSISLNSTIGWSYFFEGLNEFKLDNDKLGEDESLNTKNMKHALESFNRSLDKDPKNSWAIFSKGRILRDSDTPGRAALFADAALSLFDDAIKYDPRNEYAWNERGNCLMIQRQYKEALEAKMIALELGPNRWNIWSDTAPILERLGMTEEANDFRIEAERLRKVQYLKGGSSYRFFNLYPALKKRVKAYG